MSSFHESDNGIKALARFEASDANWKEKIAALHATEAMKAKVKLVMSLRGNNKTTVVFLEQQQQ